MNNQFINPLLFCCTFILLVVLVSFIYFAVPLVNLLKTTPAADPSGATLPAGDNYQGLDWLCAYNPCLLNGHLSAGKIDYYYIPAGGNGAKYSFKVMGEDIQRVNVTVGFNVPNPSISNIHSPVENTVTFSWAGSCDSINVFIGIIGNTSYTLQLQTSVLELSLNCGMNWDYFICYFIGSVGGIIWLVLTINWMMYSCVKHVDNIRQNPRSFEYRRL